MLVQVSPGAGRRMHVLLCHGCGDAHTDGQLPSLCMPQGETKGNPGADAKCCPGSSEVVQCYMSGES